ncbi:3,4-dehydroadipyl-CoA semialdehyde dehydrogenase [Terasakiella pusilla]|uniref:3,4-dehydroadipyl-CoA semialdehyde dehydrogenase n=1 Tax=Terasakiella pusilla TaxID=64973 RepID=UPI003AA7F7A9
MQIKSYLCGQWLTGTGPETELTNPVNNQPIATVCGQGLDLKSALDFSRKTGGPALRALGYGKRAQLLRQIADILVENRDRYNQIAQENSGNTVGDAGFDVDGGIGTLKYYASLGKKLGEQTYLVEGPAEQLTRDENFKALHILTPLKGVAVHINAFNFPSWGMWEKVAVALLAGVPCFVKPATATCLLSYEMVKDVVEADILPAGALSLLCGGGRDLMDHLGSDDLVAFTGSADTANMLRQHKNVIASNLRFAVEADSLNACILGPDVTPEDAEFEFFIKEIVRELTVKAGQKCTAIRRIIVPKTREQDVISALKDRLAKTTIGDPRDENVRMGPLVNAAQLKAAEEGLKVLQTEAEVVVDEDNANFSVDPAQGAFFAPRILRCENPLHAQKVHEVEVFGPVATVMGYETADDALTLGAMGGGSLACSVFTSDDAFAHQAALDLSASHGRVLIVNELIAKGHSGHGVVMPQCIHGGPGRAGGGEEMGGLRGLYFYHRRSAIQTTTDRAQMLLDQGLSLA